MYSYNNDGFDPIAYLKANKALYIIFIILILLANGLLIFKNVRKGDFMYKPKSLTILSLAIGDVLLALFPMVVQTKVLFGDYAVTGLSCSTTITSGAYSPYLITFVYGIGLMVLGFEIIQSQKSSPTNKNTQIIYSLAYSSFPWILGLIVVLPLGMANLNIDTCQGTQTVGQARALVVIGIILPALGAVITSIIVKNKKPQTVNSPAQALGVLNSHSSAHPNNTMNQGYAQQPPQLYNQPPTQPYSLPGQAQYGNPSYPGSGSDAPTLTQWGHPNTQPKVNRLLAIAIVYFVLVSPLAIYLLSYILNSHAVSLGLVLGKVVDGLVIWLNYSRSIVTPLMMYGYADD
ncbi:unnamed protein product [Lymnaea stagnalis]|uniref:G-protein coupled receptors family 1 profile domain-containing protein n=1 Tax=Lymnaea stagnalis TaxID=6523 RepID=A0AAV2IGF8_LYMST